MATEIGVVTTEIGAILLHADSGMLSRIELVFDSKLAPKPLPPFTTQIQEYLEGCRKTFDFPLYLPYAGFKKKVLLYVKEIPFGRVVTYGEVAKAAGSPGAARAVGQVMKRNPLPIVIPCHRVVSVRGIGGFSAGLEWKRFLLELEGVSFDAI
ncbi:MULTISPECIES: methylated-DNA--[protein]-cysteine S-methyltransferase [unclassified Kosmotoga]|jgi:methylated-DNA-[protein]-cysteine S-methyltransferase|uniref:methylated-DNA--[protein]-cysteine S-methyltransferase n=1 Tax=unclassified Kosmotoga TaxID=2631489 RepID=UPI0007C55AB2|nr:MULTISPECIES: MGMT family protein [unclassified Kosmotoga]MDI3524356.1 methylated-DNA-[protein]-cysteine S-methyltransferase [Kosmotoga sp.]MDK2953648.1 methylated-DNA-[protein]-cysteine S-methyltransferase [Kosmotoga sp.]